MERQMENSIQNPFKEEIELSKADEDLIRAYRTINRSVDDLAYTPDFEKVYQLYTGDGHSAEKHEVFRRLLILRKSGLLPRLFRPAETQSA
jgi:hypothetical protein